MHIIRCSNGHFYDTDRHTSCPLCPEEPLPEITEEELEECFFIPDVVPSEPARAEEVQTDAPEAEPADDAVPSPVEEPITAQFPEELDPPVGWVVCVAGADRGKSFCLYNRYNYIGSDTDMEICLSLDTAVAHRNAAVIAYDERDNTFSFGPCGAKKIVRVNDKLVLDGVVLEPYDEISVGSSKLRFVPLCCGSFRW